MRAFPAKSPSAPANPSGSFRPSLELLESRDSASGLVISCGVPINTQLDEEEIQSDGDSTMAVLQPTVTESHSEDAVNDPAVILVSQLPDGLSSVEDSDAEYLAGQAPDIAGLAALDSRNQAPTIRMGISYGAMKTVTLFGRVRDEQPGGLTVNFSGVVTGSTTTLRDGSFSFTAEASGLGVVEGVATDAQGLESNTASVRVTSDAPRIRGFEAIEGPLNLWTFQGFVVDESPRGLTVEFGGLRSLQGETALVDGNGFFLKAVELARGEEGTATAQTTDWWGLESNLAEALVDPT